MRLLIAFILPWLTFFTIGRPIAGLLCLLLQITLIGWLPATIWAVYSLSQYKTDQKIARAVKGVLVKPVPAHPALRRPCAGPLWGAHA